MATQAKTVVPICAGAQYRDVSTDETHGDLLRVKSVWVDEDGETQVQVFTEDEYVPRPSHRSVHISDLMGRIDDTLIRVNSDHEAWEWRQD